MRKRKTSGRRHDTEKTRTAPARGSAPNGEWVYGRHAVLAALNNPRRGPGRLLATVEAAARLQKDLPGRTPQIVARAELDALLPESAVHQGIALDAPRLAEPALEDVLADTSAVADSVLVVLDQVTDPHNVGAVLRSAAAFAAAAVIVQDRASPPSGGALTKAASGALDIVPLVRVTNLARALDQLGHAGFWRIGFDSAAEANLDRADVSGRIALVLGAEGSGLRRLTREHCDTLVRIDAPGQLKSLNVSNAAAIALHEAARRRPR